MGRNTEERISHTMLRLQTVWMAYGVLGCRARLLPWASRIRRGGVGLVLGEAEKGARGRTYRAWGP
jgi:hypothetical protein